MAIESEEEIPANPEDYKKQPGYVGVTEGNEEDAGKKEVVSVKKNGDASFDVEYSDGTKRKVAVSNDDWDALNDDYLKNSKTLKESGISDDSDLALENRIMSIASSIEKIDEAISSVLKKKV